MNACCVYDFTQHDIDKTPEDIIETLKKYCKKYTFQLEEGSESGKQHYQGRFSLKIKKRLTDLPFVMGHLSVTSNANKNNDFYVTKEDTRINGPWSDTDEVHTMTDQLEWFLLQELRPYQQKLVDLTKVWDMRKIDIIYDPNGDCGKSLLAEYLEYKGIAEEIPPYRLMDDIFQWVCSRPIKKCYIMDMPRGMKKDKLADLYSGIEVIKNGVAYDKRYHAKKIRFTRPRIFVFTNALPIFSLMSKDRWNVWQVTKDFDFEQLDLEELDEDSDEDL